MTHGNLFARWLWIFLAAATLTACKSDDDGGAFSGALSRLPGAQAANRPPVISGAPKSEVVAGQRYDFTPAASDPDGSNLRTAARRAPFPTDEGAAAALGRAVGAELKSPSTAR